ncbi:hypothetical protein BCR42DRAFT_437130 [Absidia repens]|uniref:FYVE zinc finger domain-containing protein n=1 Tax=Absidia repens TaxID=90262 RepID=A0A1X2IIC2_9FUNG|nr:hypothetical protein BCR42DRAFT_437130 [Absidia repens]
MTTSSQQNQQPTTRNSSTAYGNGYDNRSIPYMNYASLYQENQQQPALKSSRFSSDHTRKRNSPPSASSTAHNTTSIRRNNIVPHLNAPALKQHQTQNTRYCDLSTPYFTAQRQHRLSPTPSISKQNKAEAFTPPSSPSLQRSRKTTRRATLPVHSSGATFDSNADHDDGTFEYDHTTATNSFSNMDRQQQRYYDIRDDHGSMELDYSQHQNIDYDHRSRQQSHHQHRYPLDSSETQPPAYLARRRSLADVSSRSPHFTPSRSSALPLNLSSQHHHQQQQQQQHAHSTELGQARIRHPSWLDSAGFMRPSKCSACNPDPPAKRSIITPPVGVGVPAFGPPPDSIGSTSPKYSIIRRSSLSRVDLSYDKGNKNDQRYALATSSSTVLSGNGRKKLNGSAYVDRPFRPHQRRRLSSPQLGAHLNHDRRHSSANLEKSLQHEHSKSTRKWDGDNGWRHDIPYTNTNDNNLNRSHTANSHNRQMKLSGTGLATLAESNQDQSSSPTLAWNTDLSRSPSPSAATTNITTTLPNDDTISAPPLSTKELDREVTVNKVTKLLSQLLRPEHANLLGDLQDLFGKDAKLQHQQSLSTVMNDIIQRGGLVQDHLLDLEQQLQTLLDISQSSCTSTENATEHHHLQVTSGLSSSTLVAEKGIPSMDKRLTSSLSSVSDLNMTSTCTELMDTHHNQQHFLSASGKGMERWTAKIFSTFGKWLTDLNHGYLKNYETAPDGSITTMIITGKVETMEPSLLSSLFDTNKPETSTLSTENYPISHQYTLSLSPEERKRSFGVRPLDSWISDEQVKHCQFETKSTHCQCEFNWTNRRHHCRSSNRLPLFTEERPNQVKWSRVCDSCCYHMIGTYLVPI